MGGIRPSPIPSRREGHLSRWACVGRDPLGLYAGPRAHFDQRATPLYRYALRMTRGPGHLREVRPVARPPGPDLA
eukprot:466777-Alexandrium_andersonii.AAC.1